MGSDAAAPARRIPGAAVLRCAARPLLRCRTCIIIIINSGHSTVFDWQDLPLHDCSREIITLQRT